MKKILPISIIGVLLLSSFGAVALNSDIKKIDYENISYERDYTHTVLVEVGTGTWCYWCQFTNAALHDIYENGDYDFEYVELVDSNPKAVQRINEFNQHSYPTSFFDGGYEVLVGGYDTWSPYTSRMNSCGARTVPDITAEMSISWPEDEKIDVDVSIQNDEATEYTGHLHVYVVEIISRWKDAGNKDYHHGFLDLVFNQDIAIPAGDSFTANKLWDGSSWNNPDLDKDNVKLILAVFNSEWHQGYADPPSGDPFDAYYVDETITSTPGASNPPETPTKPDGPNEGVAGYEYNFSSSTTDPDGDNIFYMFDWGDDTVSNWLGPFPPGEDVTISNSWDYAGDFSIRVKAKDDNGSGETDWSPPLSIDIVGGPRLDISSISGGLFKLSGVVKNTGGLEASDVSWKISLNGGAFIGKETSGIISIPAGEEVTINSGFVFGFGSTQITIIASITDGPSDVLRRGGFIYLFFVKLNPGGGF
jgi:hypothetical protein